MRTNLSWEEINEIQYFLKEKGDPARWIGWEKAIAKCPALQQAYSNWRNAEKIFEGFLDGLVSMGE